MALTVRPYESADEAEVLALMALALRWRPDEPQREFFLWKHRQNPFGASPGWVATEDGRIVGFRTFMRWEFDHRGRVVRAARAVDTATHPDHQGRGVFRLLTMHGLEALRDEGVSFVFNTPNDNSRPGYLKMGWRPVGTLPVAMRPRGPGAVPRVLRARVAAERWSQRSTAGTAVAEALAMPGARALRPWLGAQDGLRTRRTPEYLAWRYGFPPLDYRALVLGDRVEDGVAVFRVRRRGGAREAALVELFAPEDAVPRDAGRRVVQAADADYVVSLRPAAPGMLPVPRQGPLLVWRAVADADMPPLAAWRLSLGDVELF